MTTGRRLCLLPAWLGVALLSWTGMTVGAAAPRKAIPAPARSSFASAAAHRDRMPAARIRGSRRNRLSRQTQRWEFIGPTNFTVAGRQFNGTGMVSGRVNGVAFDPNSAGTYWIAAATGGAWKSTDSGQTWSPRSDQWQSLDTSSVAVHPNNSNIVYVGTGDFDGSGQRSFGIMKTVDGGSTWVNLGNSQFGTFAVSQILIDPETPNTVTVTTGRGTGGNGQVWQSTDGGLNWNAVITTAAEWTDVVAGLSNSTGRRWYYAVGNSATGEVWRSADRGATWQQLTSPLGTGPQTGLDIAVSPTAPDTVYLLSGTDRRIYRSTDAGQTWTNTTNNFPNDQNTGDNENWRRASFASAIRVSTRTDGTGNTQDVLYVGLRDLAQSSDTSATWRSIGQTLQATAEIHADQHALAVNPVNPNEVLIGSDGGVYRLTYDPFSGSARFDTNLNAQLGITQFNTADFHPTDPSRMLGGTEANSTAVETGSPTTWKGVCAGGDGGGCAINPTNPSIQFASTERYTLICRTNDGWASAETNIQPAAGFGTDRLPRVGALVLDPSSPDRLYIGTNFLWRYDDTTQTWTPRLANQDLTSGSGTVSAIAIAPTDSNRIYTGASSGELWTTPDRGATWVQLNTGTTTLPARPITSIAVDPADPLTIYVGLDGTGSGHLWRCDDTSAAAPTFTNVSGTGTTGLPDTPLNSVALDPGDPATIFVGTDLGVFRTTTSGASWENATGPLGLPNVEVQEVRLVEGTGELMAATFGRGMWRIDPGAQAPSLLLSRPNGRETLPVGQPFTITWTSTGASSTNTIKIELSRDGGQTYTEVIAANAPDTGSFIWTPTGAAGTSARIRITSNEDTRITDASDANFSLVDGSLVLLAPNGGEVIPAGGLFQIRWVASGFATTSPRMKIELSLNSGGTWTELFPSVDINAGSQSWTVPNISTSQARIRITASTLPQFTDTSNSDFTIRIAPSLRVLNPNGGERFSAGATTFIRWSGSGISGNVNLNFSRDGGATWEPLFINIPNRGTQQWQVLDAPTRVGRIQVVSVNDPSISDSSDGFFEIETPGFTLTEPAAGTSVLVGGSQRISWTSTGLSGSSRVRIELSRNGGRTFELLNANAANNGSFTFRAAGAPTQNAVIRLTALNRPAGTAPVTARSAVFSIIRPTLQLVTPNGGQRWRARTQQTIQWSGTSVGSGTVNIQLSRNGGRTWIPIFSNTANDGSELWTVLGPKSNRCLIRILWNTTSTVSDQSDSVFRILRRRRRR